jgi:hypothetical protein
MAEYEDLFAFLGEAAAAAFDFDHYARDERAILEPALAALGFTGIRFVDGERDSFGPLSRVCHATDEHGSARRFVYG